MTQGKFIAFEGIDGSGITTQTELLRNWFDKRGLECYLTKEPTDGPAGAIIRLALAKRLWYSGQGTPSAGLDNATLALLFAADRMDHLVTDILPKLGIGINVISDRYYLSSLAYQSIGADLAWLRTLNSYCRKADLTIIVDAPAEICEKRMHRQRWHVELYEELEKLERVRLNYLDVARELIMEGERIAVVDGADTIQRVHKAIVAQVQGILNKSASGVVDQLAFPDQAPAAPLLGSPEARGR